MPKVPFKINETDPPGVFRRKTMDLMQDLYAKLNQVGNVIDIENEQVRAVSVSGGGSKTGSSIVKDLYWDKVWADGVHDHSSDAEGGLLSIESTDDYKRYVFMLGGI
jgi:hypothetical protein